MTPPTWTVGQLARLAGVTVRTLHHYDRIGLLRPRSTSDAGYRLYGPAELERLHLIRLYRDADVSLDDIHRLLDDPDFDRVSALQAHRDRLHQRLARTHALVATLDRLIQQEQTMSQKNENNGLETIFRGFKPEVHAAEAEARWGDSHAFKTSQRRTARYDAATWARIKAEQDGLEQDFADALAAGTPAEDPTVMDLAEQHRDHITRWFYRCTPDIHAGLADMYVADPRFSKHYDDRAPGLAKYVSDAILANGLRSV